MSERNPLVLIVEDDAELARLNARFLKYNGYDAVVAATAAQAREAYASAAPDLFILDIELPDGDGFSLCAEFRQTTDAPILFLTGKSEARDKVKGLSLSGDYYLTKPFDSEEFLAVVKSLLRRVEQTRKKIDEASIIERGSLTLKLDDRKAFVGGRDAELTPKEFAVLLILMQNEEKEITSETIYMRVWGATMNNDANAVRLTVSRLKKKLGEDNADFAIYTKYGGGYTFTVM
ncbi:MAG: response regulator transcription factor [Oscillospiraceae bacterium]|nr:response regulator transcription factor [Oscillospiraceae bacterium]